MEILGKYPINPVLFITGKTAGYLTWIILIVSLLNSSINLTGSKSTSNIIALVILAFGIFLLIVSSIHLGKSVRLGLPDTNTDLKQYGIYKISRNPMYLGFNLMTLASMIYSSDWIVIILGVYSIVTYHYIILGEERFLIARFGERYLAYRRKVRRYI